MGIRHVRPRIDFAKSRVTILGGLLIEARMWDIPSSDLFPGLAFTHMPATCQGAPQNLNPFMYNNPPQI